ncbi:hypothetical protein CPLU01_02893 [Colletotrichum plurivorum]|uniref:Uncharacterized protein n=1 Tax=Colletotrichum plurivorum TaxID=2175906 RepID=A0A8H6NLG8_9PEZI|nr:hypothetical protein CPLU01_02893 [Colletotrichum plurivorum]
MIGRGRVTLAATSFVEDAGTIARFHGDGGFLVACHRTPRSHTSHPSHAPAARACLTEGGKKFNSSRDPFQRAERNEVLGRPSIAGEQGRPAIRLPRTAYKAQPSSVGLCLLKEALLRVHAGGVAIQCLRGGEAGSTRRSLHSVHHTTIALQNICPPVCFDRCRTPTDGVVLGMRSGT